MIKIKRIFPLVLVILIIGCNNSNQRKNDLDNYRLNGNVKSFKETRYEVLEKSGEITKGKIVDWKGPVHYKFNKLGFIKERIIYQSDESFETRSEYLFDEDNNNIQEIEYDFKDKVTQKHQMFFDESNKLLESKFYKTRNNSEDRLFRKSYFVYDENGGLVEQNGYDSNGNLDSKQRFQYDENGNRLEWEFEDDGEVRFKYKYRFDRNNNMIEWLKYNSENQLEIKISYILDKEGNEVESVYNYKGIEKNKSITTKYSYDKNNNWIRKIEFSENVPTNITERIIEYY